MAGGLASLLLLLAVGLMKPAPADAQSSSSADVRRVLAPMKTFDGAVKRRRSSLAPIGTAWRARVGPCVQASYQDVDSRVRGRDDKVLAKVVIFSVALVDMAQERVKPLNAPLATAQRSYRNMTIRDRVLRAGARAKGRQLAAWRQLRDIDTCGFAQRWAEANYSFGRVPPVVPGLRADQEVGGAANARAVERAAKRLRRLGARKSQAENFEFFPMFPLAEPALREGIVPEV